KYGALEKTLKDLENSRTEANVGKMNSLLDTVKQLQVANEAFRKQLQGAGIEPDPTPAAHFHSEELLVGENMDRTYLEENERLKEQSLNAAIAISQTINYVQLRYLTQMLDAAEHVSSQKRTRAMSNSFLSDMLSRGVKKSSNSSVSQTKTTSAVATQTPPTTFPTQQLRQQHPLATTTTTTGFHNPSSQLHKNSSLSSSLFSLAGLHGSSGADKSIQYRLRGSIVDDRSRSKYRQGIAPDVFHDLRGSPTAPSSTDLLAAGLAAAPTPLPKFQYASPTSSQLRMVISDGASCKSMSVASGSRASSIHRGAGGSIASAEGSPLRRSTSEFSLGQNGPARTGNGNGNGSS
ncbi:hypothetical protein BGZ54_004590, partial [Gamsiella multidivaricata]